MTVQKHTIIIWQSGFAQLGKILYELQQEFNILFAKHYTWDDMLATLNAVYPNRTFSLRDTKLKEIGGNQAIVLVVQDTKATLDSNGINTHATSFKKRHREVQGNVLHISDNEIEGGYNFCAATGLEKKEFSKLKKLPYVWIEKNNNLTKVERKAFKSLETLFSYLNQHETYVVLRNWELFAKLSSSAHDDVDILVQDYFRTLTLLQAKPTFSESFRVRHEVTIGTEIIPFDVRHIGDGYMDSSWQRNMLRTREKKETFYVLSKENYFWSLLYHAIIHKKELREDYIKRLNDLAQNIPYLKNYRITSLKNARRNLDDWMKKNKYRITTPKDRSVRVEKTKIGKLVQITVWGITVLRKVLKRKRTINLTKSPLQKILPVKELQNATIIKRQVYATKRFIIKKSGPSHRFLLHNEIAMLQKLESEGIAPRIHKVLETEKETYLIMERFSGKDLAKVYSLTKQEQEQLKKELEHIYQVLQKHHIRHRDIRPENIILTKKGSKLIDFSFAVHKNKPLQASSFAEKNIIQATSKQLGAGWSATKNDYEAIKKILQFYTTKSETRYAYWKRRIKRYINYK